MNVWSGTNNCGISVISEPNNAALTFNPNGVPYVNNNTMTTSTCTSNMQGTTQGFMGNAQAQPQIANVQGMTQGTMGNAQDIIQQSQSMGTGIFQQNGSQGIARD